MKTFFSFITYCIASVVRVICRRESHLSLSLNRFVQTHSLTTAITNQMNNVLCMLQSIVYKVHSLSTDLNRKFVQCSVNGIERERFNRLCLFGL